MLSKVRLCSRPAAPRPAGWPVGASGQWLLTGQQQQPHGELTVAPSTCRRDRSSPRFVIWRRLAWHLRADHCTAGKLGISMVQKRMGLGNGQGTIMVGML